MSEHFPTTIHIVGNLPERELDNLLVACQEQAVCYDDFSDHTFLADYIVQQCQGNVLELCHPAQTGGDFPIIREFCRSHGLSYQQITEPGPGQDGYATCWKPGIEEPIRFPVNTSGFRMVSVTELADKLSALSENGACFLSHIKDWLDNELSFAFGPGEVFMIVEGTVDTDEEDLGVCHGCGTKLIRAYDCDPNGDMDCVCVRCRAEEAHDFDRDPDVHFFRNGECVDLCEYHRDSLGWDECSQSFYDRGGNEHGCWARRKMDDYGSDGFCLATLAEEMGLAQEENDEDA